MPSSLKLSEIDLVSWLRQRHYLFRDLDPEWLADHLLAQPLATEKLYSSRPIYTAYRASEPLQVLYLVISGGPVITRSSPLDRIIAITYPGASFGMRNLPLAYGLIRHAFPSLVEAYKTTDVVKIPVETVRALYEASDLFRSRYDQLFELREKFEYHLLNCSTYPPQAVASLLRALIYQERSLGNQPAADGTYCFDLPVDIIARTCQLNQRTVEQVLKGMQQAGLISLHRPKDTSEDSLHVLDPEGLKETYSATRDKVSWWPLK
ncbi:Crp/Fnr family transcriptional regulator [Leptolyngbya sp. NK1-12]|uniref:Crp/Fnr family transcriptional regulator n=1 Tax=Leptolyngbya sp. NK1-12 TaxID=2547451 RepID=A0AA96WRX0_9CYAN|nr:Crp/Fnr family transcriptional regulator [Leptolyngbya sp. NK1-12]WNZ21507.1 Crp/Fnr family transcriptional regulator [Leptolyngbya sp. NK1-12]